MNDIQSKFNKFWISYKPFFGLDVFLRRKYKLQCQYCHTVEYALDRIKDIELNIEITNHTQVKVLSKISNPKCLSKITHFRLNDHFKYLIIISTIQCNCKSSQGISFEVSI